MSDGSNAACGQPQCMVDQRPKFDNRVRKSARRKSQVLSKAGVIRPDKRYKAKFL